MQRLPIYVWAFAAALSADPARASLFTGDTLDEVANVVAWVALIIAPIVAVAVFWLVHILPEKVAEKRKHPQAHAIQCLCLLSLFFGGLLWPLAWLWAYSKPVFHKMAYGTDVADHEGAEHSATGTNATPGESVEMEQLRVIAAQRDAAAAHPPAVQERV